MLWVRHIAIGYGTAHFQMCIRDSYVIGQDEAKKVLSVAVYNHYKRVMAQKDLDVELQKSNIIMLLSLIHI